MGEAERLYDRIEGHRLSSEGYRLWPSAKDHMAARWELRDDLITDLLRSSYRVIREFIESQAESLLVLEQSQN